MELIEITRRLERIEKQLLIDSDNPHKLVPVPEMLRRLGISRSTYERNKDKIPLRRIGRRLYIKEDELQKIIENGIEDKSIFTSILK